MPEGISGGVQGKVDWVSFTLETSEEMQSCADVYYYAMRELKKVSKDHVAYIKQFGQVDNTTGRAPYRYQISSSDRSFRLFGGGGNKTVLFEFAGRACDGIDGFERARDFLSPISERITRIDYALDVVSATLPSEFANKRDHSKFRSVSFIRSDTGETVYVGSPKSDRFSRVYRYREPHPRSASIRIEHVFRGKLAKAFVRTLLASGSESELVAKLGNTWGWSHPIWEPGNVTKEKIETVYLERRQEDTLMWLYRQVAPAAARMLREGALDLTDFLEHVYKLAKNPE